ncbi:TPA: OmpA family protein [Pseudomonas aeruginosa]|nr:OmpA family protein [Pseudomonas aeruginosa]
MVHQCFLFRGSHMRKMAVLSIAVMLAACSSPPKPPVVSGSNRHPVNDARTAEVLSLRAELAAAQEKLRDQDRKPVVIAGPAPVVPASQTVSVNFPYNSSAFRPTPSEVAALLPLLRNAKYISVRGRTDGRRPTAGDERVALNRALAAKNWLVGQGVSPLKISVNYVSAGDYVADNVSAYGRAQNRRVDIEVFNR